METIQLGRTTGLMIMPMPENDAALLARILGELENVRLQLVEMQHDIDEIKLNVDAIREAFEAAGEEELKEEDLK